MIDVEGMIRQASTRVSVDQLIRKGKKYIQVLSREKIDELINRSVNTIVDKHRVTAARRRAVSADQLEAESRAEFQELLQQYQQTTDATRSVEQSKQVLDQELEEIRFELVPEATPKEVLQVEREHTVAATDVREIALLKKRLDKLLAYIATLEAALKTLSTAKTFSNQQVQNLLRDLGLAPDDKNLEKKKEMLKVVLSATLGIRKKARELAARGITLDAPVEQAVFSSPADSHSDLFTRSSA